jgi:hypothetical protein
MPVFHTPINDVSTTLAADHTIGDNQLVVIDATKFGTPTTSNPVRACVASSIYSITGVSGNTLTIGGTLEGTSDQSHLVGTTVEVRLTAGDLTDIHQAILDGGSVAIGSAVGSATDSSVLFVDTSGNLAESTGITYTTSPNTLSVAGQLHVNAGSASTVGAVVKAAASQTAHMQEWQYSDGTSPTYIDKDGVIVQDASVNTTTFFQRWYSADPLLAAPFLTTMSHHPNGDPETPPGAPETSSFRIGYNCHDQNGVAYNPDEKTYYDFWEINYQEGGSWMCERHICASTRPDRPEEGQIRPITLHTTFDIGKPSDVVVQFNSSQINWNLEDTTPIGGFNHDDTTGNMTFFMKTGGDDSFFFNSTTGVGAFDSLSIGRTTSTSGSLTLNGGASNITGGGQLSIHGTTSLSLLAPGNVGYVSIDANNIIMSAPAAGGLIVSSGTQNVSFYQSTLYPSNNNTVSLGAPTNQWLKIYGGSIVATADAATTVPAIVQCAASQTANLQEWRDSVGGVLGYFGAGGTFSVTKVTSGYVASFGANATPDLLRIGYNVLGNNETIVTSSQFGPLTINTQSNQNIELRPNGTGTSIAIAGGTHAKAFDLRSTQAQADNNSVDLRFFVPTSGAPTPSDETYYQAKIAAIAPTSANLTGALVFYTNYPHATLAERMRIDNFGLVGINEPSPGAQLQITNRDATGTALLLKGATSQSGNLLDVKDSAGTSLASISSGGALAAAGASFAGNCIASGAENFNQIVSSNTTTGKSTKLGQNNGFGFLYTEHASVMYLGVNSTFNAALYVNGQLSLGTNASPGAQLLVAPNAATTKGVIVQGFASQTANLQEWQDSVGAVKASVSPAGVITGNGSGLTNITAANISAGTAAIDISGNAASITGSISEGQVTGLTSDLASKAPSASPSLSGVVHFTGGYYGDLGTATASAGTITFDMSQHNDWMTTLDGAYVLAVSNVQIGQRFNLVLAQDGTGSRTVTWFNGIRWVNGTVPTLTTTANKIDVFTFWQISSGVYLGYIVGQNQ